MEEKNKLTEIVLDALDKLRPYLERDGGDMELIDITDDKIVQVRLMGNCRDCSMSLMTMKVGLEEAIKKVAPEIVGVEAIE